MRKPKAPSLARWSPLAKGPLSGLREKETQRSDISKIVKKMDGSTQILASNIQGIARAYLGLIQGLSRAATRAYPGLINNEKS